MSSFKLNQQQNHNRHGVICHVSPDLTIPDKLAANRHMTLREAIIQKEGRKMVKDPITGRMAMSERVLIDEGGISTAYDTTQDLSNDHCFFNYGPRQSTGHGFLQAAVTAFSEHYPLIIRPQHIWIMILQVVAEHVNRNSVELRSKWISTPSPATTEGDKSTKITLVVSRPSFSLGQPNDWAGVVMRTSTTDNADGEDDSFLKQIQDHTLDGVFDEIMIGDMLSNTTTVEKISMGITVMDALQCYFDYIVRTLCGFPSITLEGSLNDWKLIRTKAELLIRGRCLSSFADQWLVTLLPILDKFVSEYEAASIASTADSIFWNSMIKRGGRGGSGGMSWFNGWINIFFPYLKENEDNEFAYVPYEEAVFSLPENRTIGEDEDELEGKNVNSYPEGLSSAPVKWLYFSKKIPLEFRSGFVCAKQDPTTKAIMPAMAWYVTVDKKVLEKPIA